MRLHASRKGNVHGFMRYQWCYHKYRRAGCASFSLAQLRSLFVQLISEFRHKIFYCFYQFSMQILNNFCAPKSADTIFTEMCSKTFDLNTGLVSQCCYQTAHNQKFKSTTLNPLLFAQFSTHKGNDNGGYNLTTKEDKKTVIIG